MTFQTNNNKNKTWMLVTDDERMPNPERFLRLLPPKSMVLLRSKNQENLCRMAVRTIPLAHALGHRVLLAGPLRLARTMGADGAHLSEAALKRRAIKDLACGPLPKGFILSTSAHGATALIRAKNAKADFAILGVAFASRSHLAAKPLGAIRFQLLANKSPVPIMAIGGINRAKAKRLSAIGRNLIGYGAIEMFTTKN
ncbi:MAG: thiamine phosphate synthase [Rhodospirillaceae bacterium]|nr:thiamine phosphate synthase [Rhodospirillaceae bacterium]MCK5546627.1 thiamine phosphate synthase [Rhodospirillaceae bacterium]